MAEPTGGEEWKIEKRRTACAACSRAFGSEERHVSSIVETEGRFARRDVCLPCWEKQQEKPFSFWITVSPRHEQRTLENIEAMTDFFRKLVASPSDEPTRGKIAYLTALLLMRKRRVKSLGSRVREGRSWLVLEKSWDGETLEIPEPAVSDEELAPLKAEMEALFREVTAPAAVSA